MTSFQSNPTSILLMLLLCLSFSLLGQSKASFNISIKEKQIEVKIPFSNELIELWEKNNYNDDLTAFEKYFRENFILYGSKGQAFSLENLGLSDVNPSDAHPDYVLLIYKGRNITRIENRCFEDIEGHENHHQISGADGSLEKAFVTTSKKPIHVFPLKTSGARLFPTNHPFWIILGILAIVALFFLARRISKT